MRYHFFGKIHKVTKPHNHICDVDLHSVTNINLGDLTVADALTPGYYQEIGSELWVRKTCSVQHIVMYRATAF